MSLSSGTKLGPYEIHSPIGAGGMGEVYRATDTRIPRAVAIKVLPEQVGDDPARRARFDREARAIGSLNHPNICTLFDVGEHNGHSFLVMELVEGETLASRLEKGPIALEDALRYATDMAAALARAHRQSIVHRDLKPANVMITKAGVKLLDFGLAKFARDPAAAESALHTRPAGDTEAGAVLGTLQYMSPEQLEGREADARSDVFAFGAVLYEMITGRKAFHGESQASLISAILRDQPPAMATLQPLAPASLDRIVRTCLEKDPDDRWQAAADVGRELAWIAHELKLGASSDGASARPATGAMDRADTIGRSDARRGHWRWAWGAATVALMAMSVGVGWWLRRPPAALPHWKLTRLTADSGLSDYAALSPDGKLVAYSSDRIQDGQVDLYVKQVAGGQPVRLTFDGAGNTMPDFSPDGSRIIFRSNRDGGGVYEIAALGGEARKLATGGLNPKFSPDGTRIAYWIGDPHIAEAVPGSGTVWVAPAAGGPPRKLGPTFTAARYPLWSPDGKHVLVIGYTSTEAFQALGLDWWFVDVDGSDAVPTGASVLLAREGMGAVTGRSLSSPGSLSPPVCWSASTNTIVLSAAVGETDDLWEVTISPRTGRVSGPVTRLTTSASSEVHPSCATSAAGTVAFTALDSRTDVWATDIDLLRGAPRGPLQRITQGPARREHASLSRAGRYVAFSSNQSGAQNIWIRDLMTGKESIVAGSPMVQRYPVIDAAGARIAYSVYEGDKRSVYLSAPGGVPEKLCEGCLRATDWSPDEKSLLTFGGNPYEIRRLDLASRQETAILKHPAYQLLYGRFSPDGRWVSFTVRVAPTRARIAIAPLGGPTPVPESAWITIADAQPEDWAMWSSDGQALYFTSSRDGYSCVWGQRLDLVGRRPAGDAFPVQHLHGRVSYQFGGWSAAAGRLAMLLLEGTGNIWTMSRSDGR